MTDIDEGELFVDVPFERTEKESKKRFGFARVRTETEKAFDATLAQLEKLSKDLGRYISIAGLNENLLRPLFKTLAFPQNMHPATLAATIALASIGAEPNNPSSVRLTPEKFIDMKLSPNDSIREQRILSLPDDASDEAIGDLISNQLKLSMEDLYRIFDIAYHTKRLPRQLRNYERMFDDHAERLAQSTAPGNRYYYIHERVWAIYNWLLNSKPEKRINRNIIKDLYKFQTTVIRYGEALQIMDNPRQIR